MQDGDVVKVMTVIMKVSYMIGSHLPVVEEC